eukprot:TRINITY_DN851_c0_g1_i10.p1 TRINITY_DN851_c0_g1~~TRINITY_DN851_c0_g1_i10.p1  ORF type:complete len:188 (+),score=35.25 TRINITY_DN851_c0_g1_i10:237-800(+)
MNREPIIWFDKACIDQHKIEDDLRCLPLFVSGCQELLVLCGRTYLKRLWCVLELFTFFHMGGNSERIKVMPLCRIGHEAEDTETIRNAFKKFDARNCECSVPSDKTSILTIIDAAFGDIFVFNRVVRNIMVDVGFQENLDSVLDTDSICSSMQTDLSGSEIDNEPSDHSRLPTTCNFISSAVCMVTA